MPQSHRAVVSVRPLSRFMVVIPSRFPNVGLPAQPSVWSLHEQYSLLVPGMQDLRTGILGLWPDKGPVRTRINVRLMALLTYNLSVHCRIEQQ